MGEKWTTRKGLETIMTGHQTSKTSSQKLVQETIVPISPLGESVPTDRDFEIHATYSFIQYATNQAFEFSLENMLLTKTRLPCFTLTKAPK